MKSCKLLCQLTSCLRRCLSVALAVLLAVPMSRVALAQTFSASIAGTVTDSTGAVVRGAKLQLQNSNTKDTRVQTSGADGAYTFTNLLPGTYKLSVTAAGFKDYVQTDMVLRANTAAIVNVPLQVGNTSEQVVVNAGGTVLLDTAGANNPTTLDEALLESLPNNTLQPLNFVFALAGTTEAQGGMTTRSGFLDQNASMFGINGGRSGESEILIDGAPSTAIDWGGLMVSPINDSVQEQQVIDKVYDAQYERGGEGVVTLITKSGTSQFHGEVYDFMRNDGLDANSWSGNNSGSPRGKFHRNQFGANVGGPLWMKHNLFFFGGYEGLRQPETDNSGLQTMPTKAEVTGDFSGSILPGTTNTPDVIYNPFSSHLVTASDGSQYYTRDPFPNNQIPSGMIDSVGGKIAALYPAPNHDSGLPYDSNNFVKQGPGLTANDKFDIRVDWAQSEKHRLFVRVSDRARQDNTPACFLCNGGDQGTVTNDHGEQAVINDTITPSSKWLINLYGAYSRWFEGQTVLGFGKSSSNIGLNPDYFQVNTLPYVTASGYYTLGSLYSNFDRYIRYSSTGIINFTRQLNVHALKFGFNYDVGMINNREDQPGQFNFTPAMTSCDPVPTPADSCKVSLQSSKSGNAIASMLLGTGAGGGTHISMDPAFSQHSFGIYFQDDWRATSRLTVTAGLRYENQRPATERYNRIAYFDPRAVNPLSSAFGSTLNGAFEYAGVNGRSRGAWLPDNTNFGPRIGLAYRVSPKLVARAGSGIFFGPASAMLSFDDGGQSPGYTAQTNWIATDNGGYTPLNLVSNPFPQGIQHPTGNQLGALTYVGYGTSQLWPKIPHPIGTLYQWSMDFQYQVSPQSVAEIGYTGVRGRHLLFGNPNLDLDQLPDHDLSLGTQLDQLVPNPYAAVITDPNSYLSQATLPYNALLRLLPAADPLPPRRGFPV